MDRAPSNWDIDRALEERNFSFLSELICRQDLAADTRTYLAKVVLGLLTGKIKYPPHRRKSAHTFMNALEIGNRVQQLKWQGVKKPTVVAATEFECSVRKVEQCYAAHKAALKHYGDEKRQHDYLIDMAYETLRESAIEALKEEHGEREFSEEEIGAAAEKIEEEWANIDY